MKPPVTEFLNIQLNDLETHFGGDVLTYFGTIVDGNENAVLRIVEGLALDPGKKGKTVRYPHNHGGQRNGRRKVC